MPKRTSKAKKAKSKRPTDINQLARQLVDESTNETDDAAELLSQVMREMGRRGGKIGGKRRMETMTAEQRSEIALKAAKARWTKKSK